jgi:glucose/arabinose dehydrogenase/PKD repeat protein
MRLSLARAAAAFGFAGIALLVAWIATPIGVPAAGAATLPTGYEERTVASGLTAPTAVDWAPDGRMFVAEKAGRVRVVTAAGTLVSAPLLDISDHVHPSGDRGLLGIAVDTSFASNRYLYLLYTYDTSSSHPTGPKTSRLTRVTVSSNNTASAETVLVGSIGAAPCPAPSNMSDCIPSDGGSHSIGTVRSAPDGTVWAGSGDGSDYGRVDERALRTHDEQSFAGKLIHVDRNGRGLPGHPFCPAEGDLTKVCTKVWAKGFRNPFRFTLRPSGLPAVADVGWGSAEEVNLAQAGRNYGWPCYEARSRVGGYSSFSTCTALYSKEGTSAGVTFPDYFYSHSGSGAAIVGGPTYTGGAYPDEFDGDLFFGDYVRGFIKRMEFDSGGRPAGTKDFATDWYGVDLELRGGELYWADFGDGSRGQGSVRRIVYSPNNRSPVAVAEATPTSGAPPLTVRLNGSGSSDPEGGTLRYDWDFGDGTSHSTSKDPSHSYTRTGEFDARLKVTDPAGAIATATVHISVGNTPPTVTITAPAEGARYRGGVPVTLTGSGTDKEDGTLTDSKLSWHVVLVHADHAHDFITLNGKNASFTPATDHDADSRYRVTLTATDSKGVTASKAVTIVPQTVDLTIASDPPGAPITYAGYAQVAGPYSTRAAAGFLTTVGAAERFSSNGRAFVFDSWSDGGTISHDLSVPAQSLVLTARYRDTGPAPFSGASSGLTPRGDTLGPVIRLRSRRPARRLAGTVSDQAGVSSLRIAVRRGCRWWNARAGRLGRTAKCAKPRWMKAMLRPVEPGTWAWSLRLGGRLPRGRYTLLARALDGHGNVSSSFAGRPRLRVGR